MIKRAIISTWSLLGLSVVLATFVPIRAEDPKPAEPPKAGSAEPKGGGETPDMSEQEMLDELLARRDKARREQLLMEAQLAVKKAEVQRADAEVRVFRVQHPSTLDQKAFWDWVGKDPEVIELRARVQQANERVAATARLVHSPADPSLKHDERILNSLRKKLEELVKERKVIYIQQGMPERPSPASRSADAPGELNRTLDRLIGELENLRRALPRETREP